jgi:hypothetical protein
MKKASRMKILVDELTEDGIYGRCSDVSPTYLAAVLALINCLIRGSPSSVVGSSQAVRMEFQGQHNHRSIFVNDVLLHCTTTVPLMIC